LLAAWGVAFTSCIADKPAAVLTHAERAPTSRGAPPAHGRASATTLQSRLLPSGLLVLLDQDPYATRAGVVSIVQGGSSTDPAGSEGLAHLVEHLTFRAAVRRPDDAREPARRRAADEDRRERLVRLAAVEANGLTSADTITFYEFGQTAALTDLFDLEAERLSNPLDGVDEAAMAIERRVIASEYQAREDPRAGLWATSHLVPLVFPPAHPYARPPGGSPRSRDTLTFAGARAYAAANFRPERITLLVTAPAGAIDLDSLITRLPPPMIGDASHPQARSNLPPADTAPDVPARGLVRVSSPLRAQQLWLAWLLPDSYGRYGALESALTQWVQEDLDTDELRKRDPHIRQTAAVLIPGRDGGVLAVRVLLKDGGDPNRVVDIVTQAVSTLWTREAAERGRLELLRATVETQRALGEPSQEVRAVEEAQQAALSSRPRLPEEAMQAIASVTSAELVEAARHLLARERRQAVVFTPTEVGEAPLIPAKVAVPANPDHLFRAAASWDAERAVDRTAPVSGVTQQRLANGLTVIVARRRSPSVVAWLGFHGGYADADPPLTVQVALRTRPDAVEAARHGALSGRAVSTDASVETLEFSPENLAPALAGLLAKGTVPLQAWPSPKTLDRVLASVDTDLDPSSKRANRDFRRAMFGAHPLGTTVDLADLPKVTKASVDAWISRVHDLRNAVLVVVGDVDAGEVVAYVRALAAAPSATSARKELPSLPPLDPRKPGQDHVTSVLTARRGTMTDVRLGCLLPPMRATTRAEFEILRLAVEQRLIDVLRFQKGDTYNVNVDLEWLRGGVTDLEISVLADAGALVDVLGTLHAEWRRWGSAGFAEGELAVARRLYAGVLSSTYSYGQAIAFHLFNDWNSDPAAAGRDTFSGDPSSVKAARLGELFATCRANAVLGVTGDDGVIRPAVRNAWSEAR